MTFRFSKQKSMVLERRKKMSWDIALIENNKYYR